MSNIKSVLSEFLRDNFYIPDGQSIPDDASLRDLGVVDSTGVLEIVSFIEQKFEIRVEDSELLPENLDSVDAICAFVEHKRARELELLGVEGAA